MYLKSLELIGFKSFADRTLLTFDPGMTAIVGPNGCGKSNVSDSLRWVLGETSAKALRGSKMEDVIFSGTDARKAVAMAEVSVAFAECEGVLGTDFHEVTVTRRVFRSGEGQYFLNKTPCRLKDIQRLFLGTGIGTDSYSMMEQGRIDQVLSSHPDDRREIFEEAAGITRYKSDKKEALRKLEQTEANLLRLADVVREVKRQIGSLQRQAGKARRYKELRARLREFDLYRSAGRLAQFDRDRQAAEAALAAQTQRLETLHAELRAARARETELRAAVSDVERTITGVAEARASAQTRLDRNADAIRMNRERLAEHEALAARDRAEVGAASEQAAVQRQALADLERELAERVAERDAREREWQTRHEALQQHDQALVALRAERDRMRNELLEAEATAARLQNQTAQLEAREREGLLQRERLGGEHARLAAAAAEHEERERGLAEGLASLEVELQRGEQVLADQARRRAAAQQAVRDAQQAIADLRNQAAARQAQAELLTRADMTAKDFPEGARQLLDPEGPFAAHRPALVGALAHHIEAAPGYRVPLEAALRAWLDAVVVTDPVAALAILDDLRARRPGAARLLAVQTSDGAPGDPPAVFDGPGEPLIDHVRGDDAVQPLLRRLLAAVRVIDAFDALPPKLPRAAVFVTPTGAVLRGEGAYEFWMPDASPTNPLSRRHMIADLQHELEGIDASLREREAALQEHQGDVRALEAASEQTQAAVNEHRRAVAVRQGEKQVVGQAARQARERLETVGLEIEELNRRLASVEARRELARQHEAAQGRQAAARQGLDARTQDLHDGESRRATLMEEVNDLRMRHVESRQLAEHLTQRQAPAQARLRELEALIAARTRNLEGYQASAAQMRATIAEAEGQTEAIRLEVETAATRIEALRGSRDERAAELATIEAALAEQSRAAEETTSERGRVEVSLAECRMREQNLVERTTTEYGVTIEELRRAPAPAGEGVTLTPEALDAEIAEGRSRIEAMGPVNLVAIEEYQELEERHAFLTQQEADLQNGRLQLLELIRKINTTTAEMFRATFDRINANFQVMFERLFNGGTARLVMIEGEDVLEAGIDIIARPPGKRLQSVSLLSGGERTMTAVALLFSIYMIKPSPFCALDELDAALDESNIGRFVKVLEDFLKQSQFIVITHNRRTISGADTIYGVTMPENGISRVVSMKFSEYERNKEFHADARRGHAAAVAAAGPTTPEAETAAPEPEPSAAAEVAP